MILSFPMVLLAVILNILNGIHNPKIQKTNLSGADSLTTGVKTNDDANSCLCLRLRSCLSVLYLQFILVFSFIIQFRIKSICHTSLSFRMKYYLVMRVWLEIRENTGNTGNNGVGLVCDRGYLLSAEFSSEESLSASMIKNSLEGALFLHHLFHFITADQERCFIQFYILCWQRDSALLT